MRCSLSPQTCLSKACVVCTFTATVRARGPGLPPFVATADDVEGLYASIERDVEGLKAMTPVSSVTVSEAAGLPVAHGGASP